MALTRPEIAAAARRLADDGYGLYLASNRAVLERLETAPFGLAVTPADLLAPAGADWSVADLMRVYNVLNAAAFGDKGIPLQNWVMIDLGLLPSAFLLVTLPAQRAREALEGARGEHSRKALRAVLDEAARLGYPGPVPVAAYCAAASPVPGGWVGWSLCSAIPGIGSTAKGLALEVYRARTLTGVAQFTDLGLRVHRKFGRMEILTAVLDLHPVAHTMVYRTDVYAPDEPDEPTFWMESRDLVAQRDMQARIDAGTARYYVLSPGLVDDRVPILERR